MCFQNYYHKINSVLSYKKSETVLICVFFYTSSSTNIANVIFNKFDVCSGLFSSEMFEHLKHSIERQLSSDKAFFIYL